MSLCLAISLSWGQGQEPNKSRGAIIGTTGPSPTFLLDAIPVLPSPLGSIGLGVEAFRFKDGLVTQSDAGGTFNFETTDRWFSLGRLNIGSPTTGRKLYGFRLQNLGQGLTMGYSKSNETPIAATNPFIEWIGNSTALSGAIGAGDFQFFTATNPGVPGSRKLSFTLRSDLTALFGETATASNLPKVEINSDVKTSLFVNTDNFAVATISDPVTGIAPFDLNASSFNCKNKTPGECNAISVRTQSNQRGTSTGIKISTLEGLVNNAIVANVPRCGLKQNGVVINMQSQVCRIIAVSPSDPRQVPENIGYRVNIDGISNVALENNYGFFSNIIGSTNTNSLNCGVYAKVTGASAVIPVLPSIATTGTFAGYFDGLLYSSSQISSSDSSLKKDVKKEESNIEKLSKLNPVSYNYIQNNDVGLNLPAQLQHGFIAQELEKVYPELVQNLLHPVFNDKKEQTGTKSLKGVNYMGLISVLVSSVKELNTEIVVLKEKLAANEKIVVVRSNKNLSNSDIELINEKGYFLGQNTPNPFKTSTIIEYSLPQQDEEVSLMIFNLNGQTIKEYKLNDKKGSININQGELSKGMYLYSLITNGQEIATKKMLVN